MHIDWQKKEVIFKIVYFGPGLGGKTTNLEYIHRTLNPELRGKLISFKTKEERTLYFDYLPLSVGRINGKRPRFHLYTVPGQVHYGYGRKIITSGADSIVFVADSQRPRMQENIASLKDLQYKLAIQDKDLASFPWVMQYNKRDLPNIDSVHALESKLNQFGVPHFTASALYGQGVMQTLKRAIKMAVSYASQPEMS